MKAFLTDHLALSLYALTFALVIAVGAWYVDSTEQELTYLLTRNVQSHASALAELAAITDGNGADPRTESLIRDCPRREEFESMLALLDTASKRDLVATQQLFESCGNFYAERKAIVVDRMEHEYASLKENADLLVLLEDLDADTRASLRIRELIDLEKNRSALLNEQVTHQEAIIKGLISGEDRSVSVIPNAAAAQEIAQTLNVLDKQIDALRSELFE